jgi:flavin reductase (DIM6/NTAB) family NADH-FMN oxidoreductase RutF
MDPELFKAAMRHLAGHVCLITTQSASGARHGLTATAVCSVSATPPTLLCCVHRESRSCEAIAQAGRFAVNLLPADDRYLAERFAAPSDGPQRFEAGTWTQLDTGAPILTSALASFDCALSQTAIVGSHQVFFGEVRALRVKSDMDPPLLYSHGSYGGPMQPANTELEPADQAHPGAATRLRR